MIKFFKKCVLKVFNFVKKLNSLKSADCFVKNPQKNFSSLCLKCKQNEQVHNLIEDGREAP